MGFFLLFFLVLVMGGSVGVGVGRRVDRGTERKGKIGQELDGESREDEKEVLEN